MKHGDPRTHREAAPVPRRDHFQTLNRLIRQFSRVIDRLPRSFFSRTNQVLLDGMISCIAMYLAFLVRFEGTVPLLYRPVLWAWVIISPALFPAMIWWIGGYKSIWRYFSLRDSALLGGGVLAGTMVLLFLRYFLFHPLWLAHIPTGVIFIHFGIFLTAAAGMRGLRRLAFEASSASPQQKRRALLIGTEETLPGAVRHISATAEIELLGLLTPDETLHFSTVAGAWVFGGPAMLSKLISSHAVELVLVVPQGLQNLRAMVQTAAACKVEVRVLPTVPEILRGDVRVTKVPHPAEVLGRVEGLTEAHPAVIEAFSNRIVLITGAGGSIGSELSRQVAALPVSGLVLLDRDENGSFEIFNDLAQEEKQSRLIPIVADIRDTHHVGQIFQRYKPSIVLHAAAYKHVPLMEDAPCEAVLNNAIATRDLLDLSIENGVERFLMISTDKAVRPTSVMGATKRIAELAVQSRAFSTNGRPRTQMACVRFGNVIGSRGSVVPIFLRQITAGRPLTITDEKMSRYFMTISEAAQLVLQAATLASEGEIYMLDMGDPIKITALAKTLIEWSGLRPEKDVPIRFMGTRPGEKLSEQLFQEGSRLTPTSFPRVLRLEKESVPESFMLAIQELEQAALSRDPDAVLARLAELPIGFRQGDTRAERIAASSD